MVDGGKVQIVFLVDVFFKQLGVKPQELREICQTRCEAISLCVLRLLLHFHTSVGQSSRKKPLSWGFKFFDSRILNFEYKRRRFYDLDTHSFEKFEEELKERSENVCNGQESGSKYSSKQTCTGAKSLSCSLTEILHDFSWITQDISSPFRSENDDHLRDVLRKPRNLLFVVGDCPLNDDNLQGFLGRKEVYNEDILMTEIFSPALYEEFRHTRNLSFFWIDTGLWCLVPEKMDFLMKEWDGYKLMAAMTRQLNGNIIPISSLAQYGSTVFSSNYYLKSAKSQQNLEQDGTTANKPCDETLVSFTQSESYNRVMQATFSFSFGGVVQAFLSGKDLTGIDILSDAVAVPKKNGLLHGFLYFEAEKICHIKLTQMITEKRKPLLQQPSTFMVNVSRKISSTNSETSLLVAARNSVDDQSIQSVGFSVEMDKKCESVEATKQDFENKFFIKGVISCGSIPPSWLYPTKLYSCLEYGKPDGTADSETLCCSSGLLQQLLLLISSKGLNMVVELCDPETCAPVVGLLQPVTSVCAILSVVKTEMLLMIEKLLLNQKSHGCTLVSRAVTANDVTANNVTANDVTANDVTANDVTANDIINPPTLSVGLCENTRLSLSGLHNDLKRDSSNQKTRKTSSHLQKNVREKNVGSFIRVCKQQDNRKDGNKELLLKLRDYYSQKRGFQGQERNEDVTTNLALTRGRLCQDTSLKNKATSNQETKVESNSKPVRRAEIKVGLISSGLDSDLTDAMEIDEKSSLLTDISTVGDFKACLEDGYKKCVNLESSAVVFVTHAFIMIDRLKASGELKDADHTMTVLKCCVLRDNKSLREVIEKSGDLADKDKIVQEYKLQVFLRLEMADKFKEQDQESLADQITEMLRAISFQKDPIYLSSFLKNSVITRYAGNLSKLLCHVYDGLMQRPPKEILSPSHISSEEDTPLKSRKVSSVSSKSESVEETKNTRTLVRRHSVLGVPDQRRAIVVPVKVKSTKTSEKGRQSTSNRKTSTASAPKKPATPVKKVRRNLFTKDAEDGRRTSPRKAHGMNAPKSDKEKLSRRHSIASFSRSKKVSDTPVCKQVSKRMLRRQEWGRRQKKTVTDVTVVGESPLKDDEVVRPFPRKSPRRRAATFYSTSSRTSLTSASTSKAPEKNNEEYTNSKTENPLNKESRYQSSGAPSIYSSGTDEKLTVDGTSSRRRFQLSLKKPACSVSDEPQVEEPFNEVFMDETTSHTVTRSCGDPLKSPLHLSRIPFKSHLVPSITLLTHRSKSTPSMSQSSPVLSHMSPLDPKRPLNASASFPSTSPVLFKSHSHSEQMFDIAIPLTPIKTTLATSCNSGSKRNTSPSRWPTSGGKTSYTTTSINEGIDRKQRGLSPGEKRPTVSRSPRLGELKPVNQASNDESDSDNVVGASPRLHQKRSFLWSAKPSTYKTDLHLINAEISKNCEYIDDSTERATTNDTNGGCSTVTDGQKSGHENLKQNSDSDSRGTREQSEVFTSPVATKRKRLTSRRGENTSGSVSPLNQILKQRKNPRNPPPGTSCEAAPKHVKELREVKKHHLMETDDSSSYPNVDCQRNPDKTKYSLPKESDEYENNKSSEDAAVFDNGSRTVCNPDTARSSDKTSPSRPHSGRNKLHLSPSCSLQPHFTPMALSAKSLKHLEQSPVLVHSSSQSPNDCPASLVRKWSDRMSPLDTSRKTLRKRLRHDS